eukprot:TRINITY_DN49898_c0_g1_i1.p1 TRINITY_DN49898_c0_g1~~TRINITY_DN49898_c0_g1_i1.p1  ORF type:complete len:472 (-),score=78.16 TRINITY_DN49898_c0_g1_i1:27-1421(-)
MSASPPLALPCGELWLDIWDLVETPRPLCVETPRRAVKRKAPKAAREACEAKKKRRLVGKQPRDQLYRDPLAKAIEIFVKRRLWGKQPKPAAWTSEPEKPAKLEPRTPSARSPARRRCRGHYDVLLLDRRASSAEVRTAYRRRALATHPDKGGSPEEFHRVSAAFEVLGDAASRAAYDAQLTSSGNADGTGEGREDSPSAVAAKTRASQVQRAAARVAQQRLLGSPTESWRARISQLADETLKALLSQTAQPKRNRGVHVAPGEKKAYKMEAGCNNKYIRRDKSGYTVKVTWAGLNVCTNYTQSIAQAIDWQIALFWLKDLAQVRLKSQQSDASTDPLTEQELEQALDMEPSLQLSFFVSMRKGGKLFHTPAAPDLSLAMDFRQSYLAAVSSDNPEDLLQQARTEAARTALEFRQERRQRERTLAKLVADELLTRGRRSSMQVSLDDQGGDGHRLSLTWQSPSM